MHHLTLEAVRPPGIDNEDLTGMREIFAMFVEEALDANVQFSAALPNPARETIQFSISAELRPGASKNAEQLLRDAIAKRFKSGKVRLVGVTEIEMEQMGI